MYVINITSSTAPDATAVWLYAAITNFDWNTSVVYGTPGGYQEPILELIQSLETPLIALPTLYYTQTEGGQQLGFVMVDPPLPRILGVNPPNTYVYYAYSSNDTSLVAYAGVIGCNAEDFTVLSTFSFYPTTNETTLALANFNYFDSFNVYSLNVTQFVYSCGFAFYQAENCQNATYMRPCLIDWSPTLPIISDVVGDIGINYTASMQTSRLNAGYPSMIYASATIDFFDDTFTAIDGATYPTTDTLFVDIVNGTVDFGIQAPANTNFTLIRLTFSEMPYSTYNVSDDGSRVGYVAHMCSSPQTSLQTYSTTTVFSITDLFFWAAAWFVSFTSPNAISAGLQGNCALAGFASLNCPDPISFEDCVTLYQATL